MQRSGRRSSSSTSMSMIRTVLDWSHVFILILLCNWNDIHWLTNYPFCFTHHSKQCGNCYSSKLYRVSHSCSDAQKPSGWPQDWLYSDVPVGKLHISAVLLTLFLFLLSGWCHTRPFCTDFKIPCDRITLIWLNRLAAIYFSCSGNHSNYITDGKKTWLLRDSGGLNRLFGEPWCNNQHHGQSLWHLHCKKKMLSVLHFHANIVDCGQFSILSPILCKANRLLA